MAKDYYQTLGLSRGVPASEISRAFKKLARKYHPDINPGDKRAEEKFKEISEAYEVLSNPDKRKKYDAFGSVDFEGFPGSKGAPFGGGGRTYTYTSNPFEGGGAKYGSDFDLGDLSDMFGDLFGGAGLGGQKRRRKRGFDFDYGRAHSAQARQGKDLHFSVDLDFLDALNGCKKKIRLSNGVSFKVKIPAGVSSGSKIRLAGKGEPGFNGGQAGDLFIEPRVKPHAYFRRKGDDVLVDVPITLTEAIEGAKVGVPTVDGMVSLKIPAGSQSGQKLRLKGKGAINIKTKSRGDQYVILQVKVPENLDSKAKEEIKKIIKKKEKDPRAKLW